MEEHTISIASSSLVDNKIPDNRIIKADLLPDSESQLDAVEMKEKPIMDASIPYRDLTTIATKKKVLHDLLLN